MDDGQVVPLGGPPHHPLPAVEQGANLGDAHAVQVGHRLEAGQPSLIEEGEEEGLHGIVVVVAQGNLIQPQLGHGIVEGSTAHLSAHGAGILFLAHIKNNVKDLGGDDVVGHLQLVTQGLHRAEVHLRHAGMHRQGVELKGHGVELLQPSHGGEQHQGVLPPRNPHSDTVSGLNHIIILNTTAQMG